MDVSLVNNLSRSERDETQTINVPEEKVNENTKIGDRNVNKNNSDHHQRKGFTSENFKIEVNGLPKFFGVGEAKKLFKKLGLRAHKFKPVGGHNAKYMFVNFSDNDEKMRAIKMLDGFKLKGSTLKAFSANAAKDPLITHMENASEVKSMETIETDSSRQIDKPASEQIAQAVCPLWVSFPVYEDQLKQKFEGVKNLMRKLKRQYLVQLPILSTPNPLSTTNRIEEVAVLEPIVPSPVVNGYRNKCEFSVGKHPESGKFVVGFRLSSYKKGSVAVVDIDHLPQVSDMMKGVAKHFQNFVQNGENGWKLEPYEHISQQGYWRQLTVRSSRNGNLMVLVVLHPQSLSNDERNLVKTMLVTCFDKLKGTSMEVSSLHIQYFGQKEKGSDDPPIELLSGSNSISETLMGGRLIFHISPQSFFQVNVEGAENLYNVCAELAGIHDNQKVQSNESNSQCPTTLFDVCCGTGTIGLCLASRCHKVIGVDCVQEAVENANNNAKSNGVTNAEFHSGRAEFILGELLRNEVSDNKDRRVVAIVDPPRAGLHPKAVKALRAALEIQTLVYVSCDANAAMQSLVDLGRPPSNSYRGDPFIPRRVIPVDLFPHTPHVELVILFQRMPLIEMSQTNETSN